MGELLVSNDVDSIMDTSGEVRSEGGDLCLQGRGGGQPVFRGYEELLPIKDRLVENESYCRQVSENPHEVFWLVGLEKKRDILYIAPSCQYLLGYTQREIYSDRRKWLSMVCKADRRQVWDCYKAIKNGRLEEHEYRVVRPDGSLCWVRNEGWPVGKKGERPVGMTGVIRDITETKNLKEELIKICEHEHRHIAEELDDGISQHLTGTSMVCKVLYNKLAARKDPVAHDMARICCLLNAAVFETRFLSRGLISVRAGQDWLLEALANLASLTTSLFSVSCLFRCGGDIGIPSATVANNLFHIAKEAVNNAVKHGEARKIHIKLYRRDDRLVLSISDNGRGFKPPPQETGGMGLKMMGYRAAESGGQFKITHGKSGGTMITCIIPAA